MQLITRRLRKENASLFRDRGSIITVLNVTHARNLRGTGAIRYQRIVWRLTCRTACESNRGALTLIRGSANRFARPRSLARARERTNAIKSSRFFYSHVVFSRVIVVGHRREKRPPRSRRPFAQLITVFRAIASDVIMRILSQSTQKGMRKEAPGDYIVSAAHVTRASSPRAITAPLFSIFYFAYARHFTFSMNRAQNGETCRRRKNIKTQDCPFFGSHAILSFLFSGVPRARTLVISPFNLSSRPT